MGSQRFMGSKGGFTLIELLVVFAVIAVLAAILLPVFAMVRKNSQATYCLSNVRQIGSGIALYSADYDSRLPYGADAYAKVYGVLGVDDPLTKLRDAVPYDVRTPLKPYVTAPEIYKCPLDHYNYNGVDDVHKPTFFEECGSSYWYDDEHALSGYKLTQYPRPSENVIISDYQYHEGTDPAVGRTSVLFADFHVKSLTWAERSDLLDKNRVNF